MEGDRPADGGGTVPDIGDRPAAWRRCEIVAWGLKFDLTKVVKQRLDAEGISIPFPQRQIHFMRSAAATGIAEAAE